MPSFLMQRRGYEMTVKLENQEHCVKRLQITETVQALDVTTNCSPHRLQGDPDADQVAEFPDRFHGQPGGGQPEPVVFEQVIHSVQGMTCTVESDYRAGGPGDPPTYAVGDELNPAEIQAGYKFEWPDDYNLWGFLLVEQFDYNSEVRGGIGYTMRLRSSGPYKRTLGL